LSTPSLFAWASLPAVFVFGGLAGVAAGRGHPRMELAERLVIASYLQWMLHGVKGYCALVIFSITMPWEGTLDAVYESVNEPRSFWAYRSRTVAAPAGRPI